ncbi:MAG TPA: GNAT family N-acetyltransferase [Gemmatimonadaceae bacterium]|nr:GNAT family N-acetyltransferase [Gemmatimonadaceae bacterium]
MPTTTVTRTYLRMTTPDALRPRRDVPPDARIERLDPCTVARYRELYRDVGRAWLWRDRDLWSDERLAEHLAQEGVSVHVLIVGGEPAGYFELQRHDDGDVELVYFGLVERFIGRGLGGFLLTAAVEEGWRRDASSIWLHTCTLDHPAALANYRARGFEPYRVEQYETTIP